MKARREEGRGKKQSFINYQTFNYLSPHARRMADERQRKPLQEKRLRKEGFSVEKSFLSFPSLPSTGGLNINLN